LFLSIFVSNFFRRAYANALFTNKTCSTGHILDKVECKMVERKILAMFVSLQGLHREGKICIRILSILSEMERSRSLIL